MVLTPAPTCAQRVVMVHEEPRHRLIRDTPDLRVLDVQIQPGDTTLFHTHDTPITYVTIGTSSTDQMVLEGTWNNTQPRTPPPGRIGAVRAVESYAQRPVTHRVTNVGSTLFRLIAVQIRDAEPKVVTSGPLPGELLHEDRWFRHATLSLDGGQRSGPHLATAPSVLVLVRDGRIAVEHADSWVTSLETAGQTAMILEGDRYWIRNSGTAGADVVIVEVR